MENQKVVDDKISFDVVATLLTIENDEMIDEVFREYVSLDYPKLHKMHESGLLNDAIKAHIKAMFMFIIKNKSNSNQYQMFFKRLGRVEEVEEVEVVEEITKSKKVNRPRVRIKKASVMKAKETDKGICHDAALATLRLKNLHPRLERCYANQIIHNEPLTDDQWKQIIGLIDTAEKKLNQILKNK